MDDLPSEIFLRIFSMLDYRHLACVAQGRFSFTVLFFIHCVILAQIVARWYLQIIFKRWISFWIHHRYADFSFIFYKVLRCLSSGNIQKMKYAYCGSILYTISFSQKLARCLSACNISYRNYASMWFNPSYHFILL